MKNTAVLVDTNIVLDFFLDREPFAESADKIMRYCIIGKIQGYLASHTLLNAFYITRKQKSIEERKEFLLMPCEKFLYFLINGCLKNKNNLVLSVNSARLTMIQTPLLMILNWVCVVLILLRQSKKTPKINHPRRKQRGMGFFALKIALMCHYLRKYM